MRKKLIDQDNLRKYLLYTNRMAATKRPVRDAISVSIGNKR